MFSRLAKKLKSAIQTRTYETRDGRKATATEVVCDNVQFLDPKDNNSGSRNNGFSMEEDNFADDSLTFSEEDLPF